MSAEDDIPLPAEDKKTLLARFFDEVDHFFIRYQQKLERLTAIAVTLFGSMNITSKIVHRLLFYDELNDMAPGTALQQHTDLPVFFTT